MRWIRTDSVASTNSYLQELFRAGKAGQDTVIVTDYQEHGKGQGEHTWHSERGKNLLLSLLLFPEDLSASRQFRLSMMVSLAICELLDQEQLKAEIKWPNDILAGRRKIAGILIENGVTGGRISHSVIGIGLNLNQTLFPEFPVRATSMVLETGREYDRSAMASLLVERIMIHYGRIGTAGGETLEKQYLGRLFLMDRTADFRSGDRSFSGRIEGVNGEGQLLVREGGTRRAYGTHEISFRDPPLPEN